jgi:hypothetical protein
VIESLLLAVTPVVTMAGDTRLTNATAFFFERDTRLYLVTARHVVLDEANGHRPDQVEIELHDDPTNVASTTRVRVPLYRAELPLWREARDSAGLVDVIALDLDRSTLPEARLMQAFTPDHLVAELGQIEVGTPVIIVGFPLGFHDALHHLPVARQAVVASAFGIRFAGNGYFLTDARMHRGASGAPVVLRSETADNSRDHLSWLLLGVHASRLDVDRDVQQDSRLSLNCAWYADVLMTLTGSGSDCASRPPIDESRAVEV